MVVRTACAPGPHQSNLLIAPTEVLHPDATFQRRKAEEFTNDNQLPGTSARLMEEPETPGIFLIFPSHDGTLASTRMGRNHHAPLLCLVWQPLPERARRSRWLFVLEDPFQHISLRRFHVRLLLCQAHKVAMTGAASLLMSARDCPLGSGKTAHALRG